MAEIVKGPRRVGVREVRERQASGAPLLLVSAYPRKMYDRFHLDGAIPLEDLEGKLASLGRDARLVFT